MRQRSKIFEEIHPISFTIKLLYCGRLFSVLVYAVLFVSIWPSYGPKPASLSATKPTLLNQNGAVDAVSRLNPEQGSAYLYADYSYTINFCVYSF